MFNLNQVLTKLLSAIPDFLGDSYHKAKRNIRVFNRFLACYVKAFAALHQKAEIRSGYFFDDACVLFWFVYKMAVWQRLRQVLRLEKAFKGQWRGAKTESVGPTRTQEELSKYVKEATEKVIAQIDSL